MAQSNSTNNLMKNGLVVSLIVTALILGLAGGAIFAGMFPESDERNVPELENASSSSFGENPATPIVVKTEPVRPVVDDNNDDEAKKRAEAERLRLEERRRLAFDSPLTPGIRDAASMARGDDEARSGEAPQVASSSAAPDVVQPVPPAVVAGNKNRLTSKAASGELHLLARGSVIPTVLESPIDSELPGLVRARVSEDVRDSITGNHVLIPRGAVLIGTYGSDTQSGQQRLFVAWTDLRMPDGTIHDFERFSTLGSDGASGVKGKRTTGFLKAFGAAIVLDLAGNASQILMSIISPNSAQANNNNNNNNNNLASLLAQATGSATQRVSDQYIGSLLNRGPRFRVEAGSLMNVLIEQNTHIPAMKE